MKVIFLDIDGVLYPCFSRRTSCFHAEAVRSRLQKEGISTEGITDWDLCSVVCGFQIAAVERLRRLCEQSNAKIVLETSWKCMRSLDEMKRLFSLWRLDSYIVDMTDNEEMFFKEGAIQRYLDAHPAVENYVILDDISMRKAFPGHDVVTPDILDEESYRQALHILNHWTKELGHEHHLP